jgi:hypothetical protein
MRTPEARTRAAITVRSKYGRGLAFKRNGAIGVQHYAWQGDDASYAAKHMYAKYNKEKQYVCMHCGEEGPTDLANVDHQYSRDLDDYIELCRKCHIAYDIKMGFRKGVKRAKHSAGRR